MTDWDWAGQVRKEIRFYTALMWIAAGLAVWSFGWALWMVLTGELWGGLLCLLCVVVEGLWAERSRRQRLKLCDMLAQFQLKNHLNKYWGHR